MKPLKRYELPHAKEWTSDQVQQVAAVFNQPPEEVRKMVDKLTADEYWENDIYCVFLHRPDPSFVHLSIRRHDRTAARDWRDFQDIKNQLVGPECEGVELYPAESRLVDTANQYHLWCLATPGEKVPVGFNGSRHVSDESMCGAVQRPREHQDPFEESMKQCLKDHGAEP